MLLRKCTIAVKVIAISIGKNSAKTGTRIVPKPKPEKKVSNDANKETRQIKKKEFMF